MVIIGCVNEKTEYESQPSFPNFCREPVAPNPSVRRRSNSRTCKPPCRQRHMIRGLSLPKGFEVIHISLVSSNLSLRSSILSLHISDSTLHYYCPTISKINDGAEETSSSPNRPGNSATQSLRLRTSFSQACSNLSLSSYF
jgi:hypothetical protein